MENPYISPFAEVLSRHCHAILEGEAEMTNTVDQVSWIKCVQDLAMKLKQSVDQQNILQ